MGVRSGSSLDDGSPHITNMLTLNHRLTLLFTIANYISSIKFNIQNHLIALGLLDNLLQVINLQVQFPSLQWVSNILVLEPHVDAKKVKSFVHFPHNCLSPQPGGQSSSLACCSHG